MPQDLKHHVVYDALAAEIGAGKYRDLGRLPSEAQLVARFKMSRPTVIRALRDLQKDGLVTRRAGAGTFLSTPTIHPLPPEPLRPQPQSSPALELGLLVPGVRRAGEIFEVIAGELARLARSAGHMFWWTGAAAEDLDPAATLANAEKICEQFVQRRVAGVFFAAFEHMPKCETTNVVLVNRLREAGITVVLLDRDMSPFPLRTDLDLVGIDNFQGGYVLAQHLIKLGCRRIKFFAVPFSAPTVMSRLAGAREAMLAANIEVPRDFFQVGFPEDIKLAKQVVAGRMTEAVICGNDHTAAGLIRSLHNIGINVPRNVRVVGFDDVHYATLVSPALTTMHQPCREIATLAFRAMLSRIADPTLTPRTILLTPHLVVRESCGAYLSRPEKETSRKKPAIKKRAVKGKSA